eukprot:5075203-Prymnesium_polylepis.1
MNAAVAAAQGRGGCSNPTAPSMSSDHTVHDLNVLSKELAFVARLKTKLKPHRRAFPGTAMHASMHINSFIAVHDATAFEKLRDKVLRFLVRHTRQLNIIAVCCMIAVVGWGCVLAQRAASRNGRCQLTVWPEPSVQIPTRDSRCCWHTTRSKRGFAWLALPGLYLSLIHI